MNTDYFSIYLDFEVTVDLRSESPGMALPNCDVTCAFSPGRYTGLQGIRWPGAALLPASALFLHETRLPRLALGSRKACLPWVSTLWGAGVVSHVFSEAHLLKLPTSQPRNTWAMKPNDSPRGFRCPCRLSRAQGHSPPLKSPLPRPRVPPWSSQAKPLIPTVWPANCCHLSTSLHESGLRHASPQGWHFW